MPPGVPVACVAIDGAKNAGLLAARIINPASSCVRRLIPRYTREEIGAVWTDAAQDGGLARGRARRHRGAGPRRASSPPRRRGRLPRARRVHGRGGRRSASGRPTTTSPRSSTSSPRRSASEGRWIHYGLTSSDVLDTALALQLREAGEIVVAGRRARYRDALIERRSSTATRSASGAPTASTPSRRPSGCGSPASPSRPTATSSGCSDAFERLRRRQALRRGRHLRLDLRPASRPR